MDVVVPEELRLHGRYVSSTMHLLGLPMVDVCEVAWAAGFFDGEGSTCLVLNARARQAVLCASLHQAGERTCLERFVCAVGCPGRYHYMPPGYHKQRQESWNWQTTGWRQAQRALSSLWPYLSAPKQRQAALAFAAYQQYVDVHPQVGRVHARGVWTTTTCPLGHTDIYTYRRPSGRVERKCRECMRLCHLGHYVSTKRRNVT